MGSIESREGRRVSFGMDEEERVRVLQGIRLSLVIQVKMVALQHSDSSLCPAFSLPTSLQLFRSHFPIYPPGYITFTIIHCSCEASLGHC
ncbi:PREDICTED: MICOS complex subunit Mic25-like [Hipposideros armiger]|uniref:MICOS complex subunit Mic25-like n=1 Tax=Hipposideros armiger TaxID=186990 RepID=A0A8B7QRZ4_HIPAR|nr:PREDICTED: MICOS complex subunit Mic25-like [Hipposideros armiger]